MEILEAEKLTEEASLLANSYPHRLGPGWAGAHRQLAER